MKDEPNVFSGSRIILAGIVAFLIGAVGLVAGFITRPLYAYLAYLSAYAWVLSTVLGALLFLMIGHAMDAKWPVAVRRVVEAIVGILPLTLVGFIPIALGAKTIYPWAIPQLEEDAAAHHLWAHQRPYLNLSSFFVRAIVYFAIWIGVAAFLRQWSLRQDETPNGQNSLRSRILSAVGLFPVAMALTFASFDWLMSLSPSWYSTMFGVYWFAGGFLGAICLIVVLTAAARRAGLLQRITRSHYYALGRLMLTFVIFWAYAAYFQLFLIWIANKPHEVFFYTLRSTPAWMPFSIVLAIVQFVAPFFILLSYRVKQSGRTLVPIALWVLVAHWLDMEWLVMPVARPEGPTIHWVDIAAMICLGGAALAYGAFRLRGHCIVPKNDPALEVALRYEST